jgi:peptidoglycan/xylan/chitin deacetylase (PgdA/CDA1 family)
MSDTFPNLAYRALSRAPSPLVRRLARKKLILPYYHIVSDADVPHAKHLYRYRNTRQFRQDLDFFLSRYQPVSLRDLLTALDNGTDFQTDSFFLSFDDGNREIYEVVAPILKEKGIPATFFIVTDFLDNRKLGHFCKQSLLIEAIQTSADCRRKANLFFQSKNLIAAQDAAQTVKRLRHDEEHLLDELGALCGLDFEAYRTRHRPFLNSNEVRALLKDGFTIGAHSLNHPLYKLLTREEQLRQTADSVQFLVKQFGLDYRVFAFPHHDHGVSTTYFDEVFGKGIVQASFGTAGFKQDVHPRSLQRLDMEYKDWSARDRIREVSVEHAVANLTHRSKLQRCA